MSAGPTMANIGAVTGPVAYLTGEYPRATDTFIQREVAALRELGFDIVTCSIRRTSANHHVGSEQRQEAANTFHVLETVLSPIRCFRAHASIFFARPGPYLSTLTLAFATSPPGLRGVVYQLVYFVEAVVLAHFMRGRGITHLHNHIPMASCTVAMLASAVSNIPFSFTVHGPDIFFEPMTWRTRRQDRARQVCRVHQQFLPQPSDDFFKTSRLGETSYCSLRCRS